ncbi:MAG: HAD-IC family P-type ATPase [Desulfobacterales bacterium]|nr:HAD-IC family P-type ATPase [Desulfobacterales bacterium]
MNWYQINIEEIFKKLESSSDGLSDSEAKGRLSTYGPNKLSEQEKISKLRILIHQFTSPLIYILLISALVTFFLAEYTDTAVILFVVLVNAVIGYVQEYKAERSVRALTQMVVPKAKALRDGQEKEINSEDLVPGDVVLLASGAKVPADIRLFHTIELKVEEAMMTGESVPAEKNAAFLAHENLSPGDQINMAFMGTMVVNGRATGVVVNTGKNTILGTIAEDLKDAKPATAPIEEKINRFSKRIGLWVLAAAAGVFLFGVLTGESLRDMFMTGVSTAVAAIPEGLPIVVTIAMAAGVARMAKRNAIIRNLPTVETLGSTTVICSDKTGTLTKNEMTVQLVYDGEHTYEITGSGYEPKGEILHDKMPVEPDELNSLIHNFRIGLLCNESNIIESKGGFKVDGDPTEGALIVSAMKAGLNPASEKKEYPRIGIIPFESELGYMATLHDHNGKKIIFAKGAAEKLMDMCTACQISEHLIKKDFMRFADMLAKQGLRVLAMAYKEMPDDTRHITRQDIQSGLILTGLQGMMDPPREEVRQAIDGCKRAGMRTLMITGDHAITAEAIGRKLGIVEKESHALTGKDLASISDEELFNRVDQVSVYARVSPQDKLRIVEQLKLRGEIVAVTGDGVNDAPALKSAHIGIAMGKTGTDVAKEAADMVVADDNFVSIFHAVEEGRVVFENIRKVIFFLIPTGVAAILTIFISQIFGLPLPYLPSQILWINLVTNGLQVLALAFEPGEKGIIDKPPRPPSEGIMSALLIQRTILVGMVISIGVILNFVIALRSGDSLDQARTVAVTTMVFFQFFQTWNARSESASIFGMSPFSNPVLLFGMIASIFAHLCVIYVPAMQWVFKTVPMSMMEWGEVLLASITIKNPNPMTIYI